MRADSKWLHDGQMNGQGCEDIPHGETWEYPTATLAEVTDTQQHVGTLPASCLQVRGTAVGMAAAREANVGQENVVSIKMDESGECLWSRQPRPLTECGKRKRVLLQEPEGHHGKVWDQREKDSETPPPPHSNTMAMFVDKTIRMLLTSEDREAKHREERMPSFCQVTGIYRGLHSSCHHALPADSASVHAELALGFNGQEETVRISRL